MPTVSEKPGFASICVIALLLPVRSRGAIKDSVAVFFARPVTGDMACSGQSAGISQLRDVSILRWWVRCILPLRLKFAIRRRLNTALSTRFHGRRRANVAYTLGKETGQLRLGNSALFVPLPAAIGANRWLAAHPEDQTQLEVFASLARRAHGCLFDIGAYTGVFSALFCKLSPDDAIAFEPSPETCGSIAQLAELNGVSDRVEIVAAALGRAAGVINMHVGQQARMAQVKVFEALHRPGAEKPESTVNIAVAVTTVDEFRARSGKAPGLLKIDVEGMESEVFEGSWQTLGRDRPLVSLEIHNDLLAERRLDFRPILNRLMESGYRLMKLTGEPDDAGAGG
jgi:FkbM family methyltransferase